MLKKKRNFIPLMLGILALFLEKQTGHLLEGFFCSFIGLILAIREHRKSQSNYLFEICLNIIGLLLPTIVIIIFFYIASQMKY
ncbi:hypothetical protein EAF07_01030 [Streptococcus hillyeri]|uniref:Uncharacterized protein n=1 Tax=Streptococcus hillyeri TaxID=2282420 RepID=A0A3L9E2D9_9STRE|nr:hypothetical protein EAF07_01030 [Streptococcus hillyeri]